jgi:hypothetical protein
MLPTGHGKARAIGRRARPPATARFHLEIQYNAWQGSLEKATDSWRDFSVTTKKS